MIRNTIRGSNYAVIIFPESQLLKERICSYGSKFFPLCTDFLLVQDEMMNDAFYALFNNFSVILTGREGVTKLFAKCKPGYQAPAGTKPYCASA